MPHNTRNSIEKDGWLLTKLIDFKLSIPFDCGDCDLNEYFKEDAVSHREELLTETYQLIDTTSELSFPVGLVSLCNDSVRKEKVENHDFYKDLPEKKRYPAYPAVKIARLGIHKEFQKLHVGSHMINLIKEMFLDDNRTGCRLITVDAYNREGVIKFYQHNDFQCFNDKDKSKGTRAMFFDLKRLKL
jgi:GNAT superfamily N-acetyltransferase